MKITRVTDKSTQLTRFGLVNCYLVQENDGLTLIDAGLAGSHDGILQAARNAKLPIRRIVLTHAHMDHVGSVDALAAQLQVPVAASERSIPLLRQPPDKSLRPGEPQGKIRGGLPGIRTQVTQIFLKAIPLAPCV